MVLYAFTTVMQQIVNCDNYKIYDLQFITDVIHNSHKSFKHVKKNCFVVSTFFHEITGILQSGA